MLKLGVVFKCRCCGLCSFVKIHSPQQSRPAPGNLHMSTYKPVHRSGAVLFRGRINGSKKIPVKFYNGSDDEVAAEGTLTLSAKKIFLIANSKGVFADNLLGLTSGVEFEFSTSKPYKFCRAINKSKVYIYSSPSDLSRTRMYFIIDNFVSILEIQLGRVYVEYFGKKTIDGWIKKADLSPSF